MKNPDDSAAGAAQKIETLDGLRAAMDRREKLRRECAALEQERAAAVAAASDPINKRLTPKLDKLALAEAQILAFAEENMNEVFPGEARTFESKLAGLTCRACPPSVVCNDDDEEAAIVALEADGLDDYVRNKKSLDKAKLKSALLNGDDDFYAIEACGVSLSDDEWKIDFAKPGK